ncbi:hypothetical protein RG963_07925 [Methanosarcina sp. Z-7115]|uniref:Uncharacterized protein n=1 Tax=Methanosarcina baikalica TaxID=3073890 RepID=A0ABU2D139_9EURY|nr:hypothetical protein [Methanosarcina sp. Z-7115]MDR7665701.1 hypothetical protein [Methanosarcina sp. Z-7115]
MTTTASTSKTNSCIAPVTASDLQEIAKFVAANRETLNYLSQFGSTVQRAKAILFLKIAAGGI